MIGYTIDLLKKVGLKQIIVVVGYAMETIKGYLKKRVTYAVQEERLGTGHAVQQALPLISEEIENVLVIYGDDSAFYPVSKIKKLLNFHKKQNNTVTLLTVEKKDPFGLGRIIRSKSGEVAAIVEQKHTTAQQKKIKEINTGCYCFKRSFLEQVIHKIKKNPESGEYYLTDVAKIAVDRGEKVKACPLGDENFFQGINTKKQWLEANKQKSKNKNV